MTKENLDDLEYFLKHPDHKIVALDMKAFYLKQIDINKVIGVLNQPEVDNYKIDVIEFGQRKFYEKDLIFIARWILNKFSLKAEEGTFNICQYLFSLTDVELADDVKIDEAYENRLLELDQHFENRRRNGVHFMLNYETDEIVRTSREELTQIIISIDRLLTPDSLKIIFQIYENSQRYVDLKITNSNYAD